MEAIGVIPARYGSTRLPGKALAMLAGKPMILRVFEQVKRASSLDEVIVATDDERIAAAVTGAGGQAMMTNPQHRSGTERAAEVARQGDAKIIVNVQGDEPLIQPEMVDQVVRYLTQHAAVPMASLMTRLSRPEDLHNPHVVKVVTDRDGFALYFSRAPIPFVRPQTTDHRPQTTTPITNHQSPITVFKHLGIYGYQRDFLLNFSSLEQTPLEQAEQLEQLRALEHGYRIKLLETPHDTIGVDTPEDLARAETLLRAVTSDE
jgi:3-deoxy-manno-octulosonate cytidylyltransferase (CMP-KDO synthetase)